MICVDNYDALLWRLYWYHHFFLFRPFPFDSPFCGVFFFSFRVLETEKSSPYECGFDPYGSNASVQDMQFFVIGGIFLIFDLEILLLYP